MPRKLNLTLHHSAEELKAHYRSNEDPVESRRWHLLWLVANDHTLTSAAKVVGFNYDYARDIIKDYSASGASALRNKRKERRSVVISTPNALLQGDQLEQLRQRLETPPADGGVWTGPKVARVIAAITQKKVWPQRGWDYLKRLEYSHQRPRPRHVKGDEKAQSEFKKNSKHAKRS